MHTLKKFRGFGFRTPNKGVFISYSWIDKIVIVGLGRIDLSSQHSELQPKFPSKGEKGFVLAVLSCTVKVTNSSRNIQIKVTGNVL
jgi:hypothetical protein